MVPWYAIHATMVVPWYHWYGRTGMDTVILSFISWHTRYRYTYSTMVRTYVHVYGHVYVYVPMVHVYVHVYHGT